MLPNVSSLRGGHSLPLVTLVFGVGPLMFTSLVGIFSQYFTCKLLKVKWCCWVPAGLIGPMLMLCYSQLWGEYVSTFVHLTMYCLGIEVNSSDPVLCGSSRKELFLASAYSLLFKELNTSPWGQRGTNALSDQSAMSLPLFQPQILWKLIPEGFAHHLANMFRQVRIST